LEEWKEAKKRLANKDQLAREIRERYRQMIKQGLTCPDDVLLVLEKAKADVLMGFIGGQFVELLHRAGILDREIAEGILREM